MYNARCINVVAKWQQTTPLYLMHSFEVNGQYELTIERGRRRNILKRINDVIRRTLLKFKKTKSISETFSKNEKIYDTQKRLSKTKKVNK